MSQINVNVVSPYTGSSITLSGDVTTNIIDSSILATDGNGQIYSPYTNYVAKLTQITTGDPTSNIFQNTIGPIVWTRVSEGSYEGTLNGAFASGNVHLLYNNPLSTRTIYLYSIVGDPDKVYLDCVDINTGLPSDYGSDSLDIEIKVFP